MKVDNALRAAIRAVVRSHNQALRGYHVHAAENKAAKDLLDLPRHQASLRKYRKLQAQANRLRQSAVRIEKKLGVVIYDSGDVCISDRKVFVAAGGILPPPRARELHAEEILGRLATATAPEGQKILRELRIRWEGLT